MEAAPLPPGNQPAPTPAPVESAWPRGAQLATAFLLGLASALLAVHVYSASRLSSHPTELFHADGLVYRIDLNRASRAELLQLPGVGEAMAERIEDHRREHGPFRSVEELARVHGVGSATLERLRPWVCVRAEGALEEAESPETGPARRPATQVVARKTEPLSRPIDINRATADDLQRLPGIGPKLAQRILDERARGRFRTVDDLRRVSGIGPKTLERLRPHVSAGGPAVEIVTAD